MKSLVRRIALFPLQTKLLKPVLTLLRLARMLPPRTRELIDPPQRVLVVNITDFVGDTVMMLPLLDRLHAIMPSATVDVVTSASMAAFMRQIPYLGNVHGIETRGSRLPIWSVYRKLALMIHFVRSEVYDISYDMCLLPRWGKDDSMSIYLASMTSALRIMGHDPDDETDRQNPFPGSRGLLTCVSTGGGGLPEAIRELRLLEKCGLVGALDLVAEEKQPIGALLQIAGRVSLPKLKFRHELDEVPYVLMAPGASHPARRWPPERFAETAIELHARFGMPILMIGGAGDAAIGELIEQLADKSVRSLIGGTNLTETVAIIKGAKLLIANDSGPAHIGAGLGIPTVVLSVCPLDCESEHANSPLRVRPIGPVVRVLRPEKSADGCDGRCLASAAHCILGLQVEAVLRQAEALLSARTSNWEAYECSE
jgi:heptosyltransferase-3